MILVDSNVLMYAAGAPHPNKAPSVDFLEQVASGAVEAAIDTEVLQEIIHRYVAIRRWAEGRLVYDRARQIFPVVLPVSVETVDYARRLIDAHDGLSARDALHAAVVEVHALDGICTFDRDFDRIPSLRRVSPS